MRKPIVPMQNGRGRMGNCPAFTVNSRAKSKIFMLSNHIKGAAYGCISAISYGTNPIFAKYLYQDGFGANCVLFYRFLFGSLLLGLLLLVRHKEGQTWRQNFALTRREAAVLGGLGVIFAVSSLTYFLSFYYMSAGVAATLVFAYPVFVAVIMAVCFHERLKWPSAAAIALTAGGIALLCKGDPGHPIAPAGIALILVSALTYALYIILINRSGVVMSSVKLTFFAMLACLFCITLYASLTPTGGIELLHTPRQWLHGFMLGLLPTVVSLVFMAMAVRCIGSTPTAIMGALEPVTATLLGCLLFSEILTLRMTGGILLILFSVTLIILDSRLRRALGHGRIIHRGRIFFKKIRWK